MSERADEKVDHPRHYTSHPSGVEAIEICEHLGFCVGNAIKYLFRADHKGSTVEDLKKALWYLKRERRSNYWQVGMLPAHQDLKVKWHQVIEHEPPGAVLGDVLRALAKHMWVDVAIKRVEAEIETRTRP